MRRIAPGIAGMLLGLLAGASATAMQAPTDANARRLDKSLQALAQKYPELVGPERPGQYDVNVVLTADGRVVRSNLGPFGFRGPGQTDELDRLGILDFARIVATPVPDSGTGVAKIAMGQPIGGAGNAASNIVLNYRMLPADYDETRSALRVEAAVQAKHTHLMVREAALLEVVPKWLTDVTRRAMIEGMPQVAGARPSQPRPLSDINVLTVFMNEDGSIALEKIEPKSVDELLAQYTGTEPSPDRFWNPPPVAAGEFATLGLQPDQIGITGSVIVHAQQPDHGISSVMAPGVVVRYAWPRRPGEPIGGYPQPQPAP